ncbi:hypothetical protein SDC9_173049 [bioreactor metagenome]|uniref:Uncharacterized protein n=1 Tax=bioreactor metagenome TaxID=1076179 RepID=A0A645GFF0_9ZZZZ
MATEILSDTPVQIETKKSPAFSPTFISIFCVSPVAAITPSIWCRAWLSFPAAMQRHTPTKSDIPLKYSWNIEY